MRTVFLTIICLSVITTSLFAQYTPKGQIDVALSSYLPNVDQAIYDYNGGLQIGGQYRLLNELTLNASINASVSPKNFTIIDSIRSPSGLPRTLGLATYDPNATYIDGHSRTFYNSTFSLSLGANYIILPYRKLSPYVGIGLSYRKIGYFSYLDPSLSIDGISKYQDKEPNLTLSNDVKNEINGKFSTASMGIIGRIGLDLKLRNKLSLFLEALMFQDFSTLTYYDINSFYFRNGIVTDLDVHTYQYPQILSNIGLSFKLF